MQRTIHSPVHYIKMNDVLKPSQTHVIVGCTSQKPFLLLSFSDTWIYVFFFWFLSIFKRSFRSFAQDASVWHIRYADDVLFLGLCKPRFSCIPLFSWFISCNIIHQTCISVVFSLWSFMYATMCQSNLMQEISGSCVTRHESKLNL